MPGLVDQTTIDRIKEASNIAEVISEYVSLTKKGREMVGLCPFHDDHSPSMNVSESKQFFKCFACGAGGDVFKFVQMHEQLSYPEAIERLGQRAGITVQRMTTTGPRPKPGDSPELDRKTLTRVNDWACRFFEQNLRDPEKGRQGRAYVASRKIEQATSEAWHLGLALSTGKDLVTAAAKKGIGLNLLKGAGLVTGYGQDKFVDRLMFAITDFAGHVIGFGGRTLGDAKAKYLNSPATVLFDKSNCLYGLEQARHQIGALKEAVVVEGYTDTMMAHQVGCTNVVATLGTSLTSGHGKMLRSRCKTVVVVYDGDTAGMEAANRALEVCLEQRLDIKVATLPDKMDPCDFALAHGQAGFQRMIDEAVDVLKFKWDRLNQKFESDTTLSGRKQAVDEFLQTVATGIQVGKVSAIDRGLVVNRLSSMIGLGTRQIEAELVGRMRRGSHSPVPTPQVQDDRAILTRGLSVVMQREILEVLLNEPRFYRSIQEDITVETFDDPILKQVAQVFFGLLQGNPEATGTQVLARFDSDEIHRVVTGLMLEGEKKGNFKLRIEEAADVVKKGQLFSREMMGGQGDPLGRLNATRNRAGERNTRSLGFM
ncbi:MAG: DNA primase [Planctomycetes bacterium]|nr:DNA primase [Planctomycetota bacterium]